MKDLSLIKLVLEVHTLIEMKREIFFSGNYFPLTFKDIFHVNPCVQRHEY
jgi:hypothetical protein